MSEDIVLRAEKISKTFQQGDREIEVLADLELTLKAAEKLAIVGRSGSGKSTLLHVLAGLDTPLSGAVQIGQQDMLGANPNERAKIRREQMGFVYQNHHLLGEFDAKENIAMPLRIRGVAQQEAEAEALGLLEEIGLADRADHAPHQLSGGERQRVAVARAVAGAPRVVLADEPTGNLDEENAADLMNRLGKLRASRATAFVVVTHDTSMLDWFDRVLTLRDGQLQA